MNEGCTVTLMLACVTTQCGYSFLHSPGPREGVVHVAVRPNSLSFIYSIVKSQIFGENLFIEVQLAYSKVKYQYIFTNVENHITITKVKI